LPTPCPDGNGVEIQVDGFGDWADSSEWIANAKEFAANPIGTFFDPEKLVAAREQGLEFQEIHERTRAGDYLPEVIPKDIFLPEVW
jgi:catechol 2,3-dioxygenase